MMYLQGISTITILNPSGTGPFGPATGVSVTSLGNSDDRDRAAFATAVPKKMSETENKNTETALFTTISC